MALRRMGKVRANFAEEPQLRHSRGHLALRFAHGIWTTIQRPHPPRLLFAENCPVLQAYMMHDEPQKKRWTTATDCLTALNLPGAGAGRGGSAPISHEPPHYRGDEGARRSDFPRAAQGAHPC